MNPIYKLQPCDDPVKIADFLARLTALTNETGVVIHGCGCCESPHLLLNDVAVVGACRYNSNGGGYVEWEPIE